MPNVDSSRPSAEPPAPTVDSPRPDFVASVPPIGSERQPAAARTMLGVPVTRRNARNLVRMGLAVAWPANALVLARNRAALGRREPWRDYVSRLRSDGGSLDLLIDRALGWIRRSQDTVGSGGVGDFSFGGWTRGYPEVTGYIIPTFWDYHAALDDDDLAQRAIRMADWELRVQKPNGGFESLYEGENQPVVAFNTGQVIRGLARTYEETGEQRYLDAAVRAGDWMVAVQDEDGSWTTSNYLGMKRTYDTFAAAALARLAVSTGEESYARAALANCEFALAYQHENGWFALCDNTPRGNHAPITHTLCYASDGLIEVGEALGESSLVEAGERTARAMAGCVERGGRLRGRLDSDWRPRVGYVVLTGSAQLGIILAKMHERSAGPELRRVSESLLDFLAFVQQLNAVGPNRSGGIAGSFPVWGRYVPLKYPSWATKFYLDHLLLLSRSAVAS